MNKEIAIIIPAYNAHDTIERLLFSILNQSVKDICRVYLIDDYSEKDYFYLIDKFPWLDMVICRLDENSGPGVARNKGIELVVEDDIPYIVFADADDCFSGYLALHCLLEEIKKEDDIDFVISHFSQEIKIDNKTEYIDMNDCDIWLFGKIYKTFIIKQHNIHFPQLAQNEDVCFNLWYYLVTKKTHAIELITYCWLNNLNSITRRNQGEYASFCLEGLCRNLIWTYQNIIKDKNISEKKITTSLANRIIRIYQGYNGFLYSEQYQYKDKVFDAIVDFYNNIYKPYINKIDDEILIQEWNDLQPTMDHFLNEISFNDFIKKIKEA